MECEAFLKHVIAGVAPLSSLLSDCMESEIFAINLLKYFPINNKMKEIRAIVVSLLDND